VPPALERVDPQNIIGEALGKVITGLDNVEKNLKVFNGTWEYLYPGIQSFSLAHPMFTQSGDFFVEVCGAGTSQNLIQSTPQPNRGITGGRIASIPKRSVTGSKHRRLILSHRLILN
jgi:hypothetical protein